MPTMVPCPAIVVSRLEHYIEGNERYAFRYFLSKNFEGELVGAEIGVYEGVNSTFMLGLCSTLKLYLIDAYDNIVGWTGGPKRDSNFSELIKEIALSNLSRFNGRKEFVYKNSLDAVKDFPDEFFHFVYIDGDHSPEAVSKDIVAWYPKVKPGGIMGGHDYSMPGLKDVISDFVKTLPPETSFSCLVDNVHSDWVIEKTRMGHG